MRSEWSVQVRTFFLGYARERRCKGADLGTIVKASSRDIWSQMRRRK